jgi:prephenate dehydratase
MASKISFQGARGANSEIACREWAPHMEPLPCPTFEDAFAAVESGEAELAMIPIENTIAGRVADIHTILPQSKLHIVGEYFLPIWFHVMAKPGVALEDIHTVYSHVHGLGQCRKFIREHKWTAVVAGDTAGSAEMISQRPEMDIAAIAPKLAADIYGLNILAENVEDADHNTTRFVILSRQPNWPSHGSAETVTTFIFNVRNVPAALYKALGGFATNSINMTKLESYQIDGQFTATQFYADVEGHPEDQALVFAFEELDFFADTRILGVYPMGEMRKKLNAGA